jgi:cytoskeletal protein CcmA (bactofilin family)
MRLFAFAVLIALVGALASMGGAAAQTQPDIGGVPEHIRNADQVKRVCDDIRTTRRTPAFDTSEKFFLDAIERFCASGELFISGTYDRGECQTKAKLSATHIRFIKSLQQVRPQGVRQIALDCVVISELLRIDDLDASIILFRDMEAEDVLFVQVRLSAGLFISNSKLKKGFGLLNVTINGPAHILSNTEISNNSRWGFAFGAEGSSIHSISVAGSKILGDFKVKKLAIKEDLSFTDKTTQAGQTIKSVIEGDLNAENAIIGGSLNINNSTITGNVYARGARFGGGLLITGKTTIKGTASLAYLTTDRIHIENSTFEKTVWLDHSTVTKEALIDGKSTFNDILDVEGLQAGSLKINNATIKRSLDASYVKLGLLDLANATIAAPQCENASCRILLFNAHIDYFRVRDVVSRSLVGSNARMRVMLLSGKTSFEHFQCGDCLIEQYALVAARFNGPAIFSGAEIKGTLSFREDNNSVSWGENATLNLSELRVDTIAANACDLVLEQPAPAAGKEPIKCADQPTISHRFVPTTLTGARYRSIVPGRSGLFELPANPKERPRVASAWETMPLLDLPSASLIQFLQSAGSEQYNPQPYEQLSGALSAMGKNNEAIDVRVARINERLADPGSRPNVLVRLSYFVYYYISHYGFKSWQAFLYFVGLILVGSGIKLLDQWLTVKRLYRQRDYDTIFGMWLYSLWFSLDRAVPPLHLDPQARDRHMDADRNLQANARHWFYCHRVIGTILISIFAAGLAGVGH